MSRTHFEEDSSNLEKESKKTGDDDDDDGNDNPRSRTDQEEQEAVAQSEEQIKNKYGGLLRKKHPLITKDHDRAFFDSADWALGKGAEKSKGSLEELRPKLQPTPHQQVHLRRSAYAPPPSHDDTEDDGHGDSSSTFEDGGNDGGKDVPEIKDDLSGPSS